MATGDELNQSLQADASSYTLTVQGRAVGGQTPEIIASVVVGKKADAVGAARRSTLSSADSTANLDAVGYTGNLIDIGNSMHVAVSGRFSVASQAAAVFLALYDEAGSFIGITKDFYLQGDGTFKDSSAGKYPSPFEIVDTTCAAKVFVVLRTAPVSGNVDIYLEVL